MLPPAAQPVRQPPPTFLGARYEVVEVVASALAPKRSKRRANLTRPSPFALRSSGYMHIELVLNPDRCSHAIITVPSHREDCGSMLADRTCLRVSMHQFSYTLLS